MSENQEEQKQEEELSEEEQEKQKQEQEQEEIEKVLEEGEKAKEEAEEIQEEVPSGSEADDIIPEQSRLMKIMHDGKVHEITEEKYLELAQKGFDYDTKVAKIAPHRKIAELLEADPQIANIVNTYISRRTQQPRQFSQQAQPGFELKSIDEYETADKWLGDNIQRFAQQQTAVQAQPNPQADLQQVLAALKMHDPQNFGTVFPKMQEKIRGGQMTVERYQQCNNDIGALLQLYDEVKGGMANPSPQNSSVSQERKPVPSFKMSPGQTPNPSTKNKTELPWNLSNQKFQDVLSKVKGY